MQGVMSQQVQQPQVVAVPTWKLHATMATLPPPGPQVNGSSVATEIQLLAVKVAEIGQT